MILPLFLIFLSLLGTSAPATVVEVNLGQEVHPVGAVIVVVDGLGASYVYPEYQAYSLDGAPTGRALLFNLTGEGSRVLDMRVPVPETLKSHAVLVTGNSSADPMALGPTIFDQARENGFLCLALLQRGDTMEMLLRQDGVLYFDNNSIPGPGPTMGARGSLPEDLRQDLLFWQSKFQNYASNLGQKAYADYNRWALDAAADLVGRVGHQPFILFINVGGVDSAGQDLGSDGYLRTVQALDAPLGCLAKACAKQNVLLIVTADHGMVFSAPGQVRGGHAAEKYSSRLESRRVPLVVSGPGVENFSLGGVWSEENIAPTILEMLGIDGNLSASKAALPLKKNNRLRVVGAKDDVAIYREGNLLANASGEVISFNGLPRGIYTVKFGTQAKDISLVQDQTLNLAEEERSGQNNEPAAAWPALGDLRKIIGVAAILAINLTGIFLILRIAKKD
jgi:2,3-bisphosphoglycerate-independent phosphoglycerate mutase